ncbi:MAG: nuclear transport factor 2 family protein [Candidatus Binataceae bacterium]
MGTSENKQLVSELFGHLSAGRREQLLEMLADDATWWAPGMGTMPKRQFAEMVKQMDAILKGPIRLTIKGMTAEDDRVAVQAESDGDLVNGKHYHNTYHFLVVIRGGKIREVKEYNDTKYAADVFGDLIPTASS